MLHPCCSRDIDASSGLAKAHAIPFARFLGTRNGPFFAIHDIFATFFERCDCISTKIAD